MLCDSTPSTLDGCVGPPPAIRSHRRQAEAGALRGKRATERVSEDSQHPDVSDGEEEEDDAADDAVDLGVFLTNGELPESVRRTRNNGHQCGRTYVTNDWDELEDGEDSAG